MPALVGQRPGAATRDGGTGPGRRRLRHGWIALPVLALGMLAGGVIGVSVGVAARGPAGPSAAAGLAGNGTGLVRVLSTGQVRSWASFSEVNGIADGLGRVWLTGGAARRSHILYGVDPVTRRVDISIALPSHLVINPGDIAVGAGAAWVAVGASVYRVEPAAALLSRRITRAFARVPGVIGDVAVDGGSVWLTDAVHGRAYRFAAASGRREAVVPVGTTAGAMTVGDGGIWVADAVAHTVSRINVTDNRVDVVRKVPGVPSQLAADAGSLWVSTGTGGNVTAFAGASGRARTVRVGGEPTGLAAAGGMVWVASTATGTLSRIDARRHVVVATVRVGTRPYALAADRGGVWVALLGQPVMQHATRGQAGSVGSLAWVLRMCGQR